MQTVSNEWITAMGEDIAPEAFIKCLFPLVTTNIYNYYEKYPAYAMKDNGHAGTKTIQQAYIETDTVGYESSEVASGAYFNTPPEITFSVPNTNTLLSGFTMEFEDGYQPYQIRISYITNRDGAQVVDRTRQITENFPLTYSYKADYSGLTGTFYILKVSVIMMKNNDVPLKIKQIYPGYCPPLEKKDLFSFSQKWTCQPTMLELPQLSCSLSCSNADKIFTPNNPNGLYNYLNTGIPMWVKYGFNIWNGTEYAVEWIKGGRYFLEKFDVPNDGVEMSLRFNSVLDYFNDDFSFPLSGSENTDVTANHIFTDNTIYAKPPLPKLLGGGNMFDLTGFPSVAVNYANVSGLDCNRKEAIQYLCNLLHVVMYVDRDGIIKFKSLASTAENYTISNFLKYMIQDKTDKEKQLQRVFVYRSDTTGSSSTVYNQEGVTQYIQNKLVRGVSNYGSYSATNLANWIGGLLVNRQTESGEYRADVRADIYDLISVQSKYGTQSAYLTSLEYKFNGAFRGTYAAKFL